MYCILSNKKANLNCNHMSGATGDIIVLKMNGGNEKVGPELDLQLGMNYSNRCILKTDSGAGANAVSRLGMRLVANSPLSELVWSPDKGLSLKCADSSFSDKKTSLFWDIGPSNFFLGMPDSFVGVTSTTDRPMDDVFAKPVASVCIKSDISGDDIPPKDFTSDSGVKPECKEYEEQHTGSKGNMEGMSSAERNSCDHVKTGFSQISETNKEKVSTTSGHSEKRQLNHLFPQADEHEPSMEQNPLSRDQTGGGVKNQNFETDNASSAKAYPIIEYKSFGASGTKLTSHTRSPFEKLESSAENDLQAFNCEAICGTTSRALVSKSNEIVDKSQDDKNLPVLHSPSNRKIRLFKRKHKEKALSNGDINVKFSSKEEEESHESVESCNSSGQFSTVKRLNFQQQLMVESKRIKKQTQEVSSNSLVKQECSFMNWISNMMKGFSLSIQEARNCLAHTLASPVHAHQWPDQKLITFNENQNPEPKNTGFQFIFGSMYSPSLKRSEEDSKNFDQENKVHGIDATPITCYPGNDTPCRQYLNLNEVERSSWRYEAGPSHPKNEPVNFANSHESSKNYSMENKDCSNFVLSKERKGKTSSSSLGGQKNNTEYVDSSELSERKEVNNSCYRSDTLGSQWISRFFPRPVAPLKISDHLIRRGGTQADSSDCSRLPHSQKHITHSNKCKIEENNREQSTDEAKELQNHSINKEASANGTMDDKVNDSSMHKFSPFWPFQRFRDSEPMVSMFARTRRLNAIKYIISSNGTDKASKGKMTCFFCGTKGHQLCDCSEISGTERPDILKKVNSHVGLEGLPCSCIKCFRPNHGAISCPSSISRGKHKLEVNALVNDLSPSRIKFVEGDQIISGCPKNDKTDSPPTKTLNLKRKLNEVMTSDKMWSNVSMKKYSGSMGPPSCFVERKISDVPEKIFDAVKKLRLSRTDILKWTSSHMSLSHLNGFYLRLRLGKWEKGLGENGYYVASINEAKKQNSQQDTRTSFYVSVGAINCMVESRYISNQDFLEEEIIAWWSTSSKSGGGIPSEEDMIEKIKKKRMLGL